MSSAPSPWALERAEACDPLDDHEGSDVTRHRIALMLDAARRDGAERMREAMIGYLNREALRLYQFADDRAQHPDSRAEARRSANAYRRAVEDIGYIDPARVLAGEEK